MSSGDTLQRMELLITKSGSRIIDPARIHIMSVLIVVEIVGVTETMLPSFYTDLVQGNSWQI